MTNYWLVKSEPEAFSWKQQVANGVEPWTGVRNHATRNNMRAMKLGDLAFFYHSNEGREIVGIVRVAREAYPDPTAETGDWVTNGTVFVLVDASSHTTLATTTVVLNGS